MMHHADPLTVQFGDLSKGSHFLVGRALHKKIGSQIAESPNGDLTAFAPDFEVQAMVSVELHIQRADDLVDVLQAKILHDHLETGAQCDLLAFDPKAPSSPVVYRRIWSRSSPRQTQYPFWSVPKEVNLDPI